MDEICRQLPPPKTPKPIRARRLTRERFDLVTIYGVLDRTRKLIPASDDLTDSQLEVSLH